MKRILSILLILALLCAALPAMAAEEYPEPERFETDALTWDFDKSTGTLTIGGSGPMRSYMTEDAEWMSFSDEVRHVVIREGVTSVGECAFYGFTNLTSAVLPDSIEIVDNYAFYYCQSLRSITIPANLTYAGRMCFYNTLLWEPADLVFPEGMAYIGEEAFHSALKTEGKIVIPSTVEYIGRCAFTNAMFSDIEAAAENPCYKSEAHALLTKDGTELIAYAPCAKETAYAVPEGVTKIHAECFNVVMNLVSLSIPASVTEIEEGAIFSTFALTDITVAEDNPAYKAAEGFLLTADGKTLLAYPDGIAADKIDVPEGVERIGAYVFCGRTAEGLALTMPGALKTIGELSMPCGIDRLSVPKGLTTIEAYAFPYAGGVSEIFHGGSEADWNSVSIGEGNEGLEGAHLHFSE